MSQLTHEYNLAIIKKIRVFIGKKKRRKRNNQVIINSTGFIPTRALYYILKNKPKL